MKLFAQELLDSGIEEQQKIGLMLVVELNLSTPVIIDSIVSIIWRNNSNPMLLSLAIKSIPSTIDYRKSEVINELKGLMHVPYSSIRNDSFSKLFELSNSGEELKSIIDSYSASSPAEELNVVLAIRRSATSDESIKKILMEMLSDDTHSPDVRRLSFEALKRFHLNDSEFSIVNSY